MKEKLELIEFLKLSIVWNTRRDTVWLITPFKSKEDPRFSASGSTISEALEKLLTKIKGP